MVSSVVGLVLVILSLTKLLVLPLLDLTPIAIAVVVYVVVSLLDKNKDPQMLAEFDVYRKLPD